MIGVLMTVAFVGLAWGVSAVIYRIFNGKGAKPVSRRSELAATVFFGGLLVLMGACVAPSFLQLVRVSGEGAMKGRLGQLRQAFTRYRVEKSENPPSLDAILAGSELSEMPELWPLGTKSSHERIREAIAIPDGKPTDSGKWAYSVGTSTPIFIDCTHTDDRGNAWASY